MVDQISVALAILTFLTTLAYKWRRKQAIVLIDLITAALAAAMIPTGFILILFPFDIRGIATIQDLGVQISITGLVLLFISIKTILDRMTASEKEGSP